MKQIAQCKSFDEFGKYSESPSIGKIRRHFVCTLLCPLSIELLHINELANYTFVNNNPEGMER